jgi:2-hydroxy-6-oxonona-2,4-dienedioate hydrolase
LGNLQFPEKYTVVKGYKIRYLDYDHNDKKRGKNKANRSNHFNRTLVILHGIGPSSERWAPVIPTFSKYFRVIVPDIVGFGKSEKPVDTYYRMRFFVDFLQAFLEKLHIERCVLIGHSFGGYLATEFAIEHREKIVKLILVAPAGPGRNSNHILDQYIGAALYPTYQRARKAFMDMAFDPKTVIDDTVNNFVEQMSSPKAKYAFMQTLHGIKYGPELKGRLSRIICPTLIVWGKNDKMISADYANEYHEILNKKIEIIENCGHTPFVENPAKFIEIVITFLRKEHHKLHLHQCNICNVIFECNCISIDHRPKQHQEKEGKIIKKEKSKVEKRDVHNKFRVDMCRTCEKNQYLKKEQEGLFEAIEDPLKWRLKHWWLWW